MEIKQPRLKTKNELIKEFDYNWPEVFDQVNDIVYSLLGEPIKHKTIIDRNLYIPEVLITEEPLIPIGSKVAFPTSKNLGINLSESYVVRFNKEKQDFLYYEGIWNDEGVHLLNLTHFSVPTTMPNGDFFTANEILDLYEQFKSPLLQLFKTYLNKQ